MGDNMRFCTHLNKTVVLTVPTFMSQDTFLVCNRCGAYIWQYWNWLFDKQETNTLPYEKWAHGIHKILTYKDRL